MNHISLSNDNGPQISLTGTNSSVPKKEGPKENESMGLIEEILGQKEASKFQKKVPSMK